MKIEMRNLGVEDEADLTRETLRALLPALDRFEQDVDKVRVRFIPRGTHEATCRARVWCASGPTLVLEEHAASTAEALHAIADAINRRLRRRAGVRAASHRGPSAARKGSKRSGNSNEREASR